VLTAALSLSSPAFPNGAQMPARYICSGRGVSPPLRWSHVPSGTHAFALSLVDLDVLGGFTHWTLWNLPPSRHGLAASMRWRLEGRNSFGHVGYGAPCPPSGPPHRYQFRLYALRRILPLRRGASPAQFNRALRGNVNESAILVSIIYRS
jgi:Raf kinase inhibitor-like YbhB/YbcL family protein